MKHNEEQLNCADITCQGRPAFTVLPQVYISIYKKSTSLYHNALHTIYNSVFQSILGEEKLCSTNQQTFSGSLSIFGGWITCNDNYRLLLKDAEQP